MANVLNRISKAYLQSVNTPDFDELEWIINPDLTAVEGVPPCYWVIEGDAVREMTVEEKAIYDAAHVAVVTNKLNDGTPAYLYMGYVVSINKTALPFAVRVAGAKKFSIPFASTGSDFPVDRNRLIMAITVSSSGASAYDLVAKIDGIELTRFAVQNGQGTFDGLSIELVPGTALSFSVESAEDVANPVVLVDTAARN